MSIPLHLLPGAKLLERVVADLYESAKDATKQKFKKWHTKQKINSLFRKTNAVRNVKTIWQIDKEVDLFKFYYPSKILYESTRVQVDDLDDFTFAGNLVIQGTAGQGKSIFLRYLCARELQRGRTIPVFIELRRLEHDQSLRELVINHLDVLGLEADYDVFDHLAASGALTLFLDAFDEVDEALQSTLIAQLEDLAHKYDVLRMVVTSRPESGIQASAALRVVQLAPLERADLRHIIHRLAPTGTAAPDLIAALRRNPAGISELLTTPLMVTLLVITYKAEQRLPEQLSEFYEGLFGLLLSRHDQTKPGLVRRRKSPLSDRAMRAGFDAFCFLLRKLGTTPTPIRVAYDQAKRALDLHKLNADADSFIYDLKKITCLIIEESGRVFFIHKSVAEYHSACFVASRPIEVAEKFYAQLRKGNWSYWGQELVFLRYIDKYRYYRLFFILEVSKLLGDGCGYVGQDWKQIGYGRALHAMEALNVNAFGRKDAVFQHYSISQRRNPDWVFQHVQDIGTFSLLDLDWMLKRLESLREKEHHPAQGAAEGEMRMLTIPVAELLPALTDEERKPFEGAIDKAVETLYSQYAMAKDFVAATDATASMFDDLDAIAEA